MPNIYDIRRRGAVLFMIATVAVAAVFLLISDRLVDDLSKQERDRMQIWADATREIASANPSDNLDFLLSIIEGNHTIPVILVDNDDNILDHNNFELPEAEDEMSPWVLSAANEEFLREHLTRLKKTSNVIHIVISPEETQHLYYEDSVLLRKLSYYPYLQLIVMIVFVAVVYFAVTATKKAEQNKVWVGLSKETAHQLGTPISSLMAWVELLPSYGVDEEVVGEMDKDVNRLKVIASRFSKIGSPPSMVAADISAVIGRAAEYMRSRISGGVDLKIELASEPLRVKLSDSLIEWVIENLIKNAVDAMEGRGKLTVSTFAETGYAVIEVTDSGKGIPRKAFKTVFNPGYTTKKRGWGLGLTLAKRIINDYHHGLIFVKDSEPGVGTTFRVQLPLTVQNSNAM
ncbi:MAG: ATP-binding protein [Bacteroidales bacterium]|nr:ATP-binding protein [Bacteroidales bacterium]